jgi:hypothetical protein
LDGGVEMDGKEIKILYDLANNKLRTKWLAVGQRNMDYFLNIQLTPQVIARLKKAGMPTFVINKITPAVELMKYFVTAGTPRWQVVGLEESDTDVAHIPTAVAEYCLNLSSWRVVFSRVVSDAIIRGAGYFWVMVDPDLDDGMGEVLIKDLHPRDVFWDIRSRDFFRRDAMYCGIRKIFSKAQLMQMYPEHKELIKQANTIDSEDSLISSIGATTTAPDGTEEVEEVNPGDIDNGDIDNIDTGYSYDNIDTGYSYDVQDTDILRYSVGDSDWDTLIEYFHIYLKEKKPIHRITYYVVKSEEEIKAITQQYTQEFNKIAEEGKVNIGDQLAQLKQALEAGEITQERFQFESKRIQEEYAQKLQEVQDELKQKIAEYSVEIKTEKFTEKEYNQLKKSPEFVSTIIDEIKYYATVIKEVTAIGDKILTQRYLDDRITEYPIVQLPYIDTGCPFPMAYVTMLVGKQDEINKGHQITIHNANLGSGLRWMYDEGSIDPDVWEMYSSSVGALLPVHTGMQHPIPIMPVPISNGFIQLVQESKYDFEDQSGMFRTMAGGQDSNTQTYRGLLALDEFGTRRIKQWIINVVEPVLTYLGKVFHSVAQSTYSAYKVMRIVQPNNQSKTVEINIPIYNDYGEAVEKSMNYSEMKFDIAFVAGSTQPINRWALLDEYFKWFQAGIIDDIAFLGETDIRNKEKIIQRKSTYSQLIANIDELNKMVKDLQSRNKALENQLVNYSIKDKASTVGDRLNKQYMETAYQQKLLRGLMKGNARVKNQEIQNTVNSILQNFSGQMQVEAEKQKIQMQNSGNAATAQNRSQETNPPPTEENNNPLTEETNNE